MLCLFAAVRKSISIQTVRRAAHFFTGVLLVLASGCASITTRQPTGRHFEFGRDNFAYANELQWVYEPDLEAGKMRTHARVPKPDYHQYCFVMSRAARQFYDFARFDPKLPKTDEATYRRLIDEVLSHDPRSDPAKHKLVVIPGYADLYDFSRDYESDIKDLCGGGWQSYVQRGHWRMLFPFSDAHQAKTVVTLRRELEKGIAPVIHVVLFPAQTINHGVVVYRVEDVPEGVRFWCYDPNNPKTPLQITYQNDDGRFHTPMSNYFFGGEVDVYEVYRNWRY